MRINPKLLFLCLAEVFLFICLSGKNCIKTIFMKKITLFAATLIALSVLLFILLPSCKEIPPYIDFTETLSDTSYLDVVETPQNRIVLLEEFSGVRCVNCPAGHEESKNIAAAHPGRFAYMVLHAGFLTAPYPDSQQQFVIEETSFLYDFLEVLAVPAAAIDRVKFSNENTIALLNANTWAAKVEQELQKPTPANLYLTKEYDPDTRTLRVTAKISYTQTVSTDNNLSIFITESHIIDPQLKPEGASSTVDPSYEHNHIVRDMLTAPQGIVLNADKTPGRVIVKVFETNLPDNWVAENCEITAFVHNAGDNKEILQGATIKIVE